jgi:hypothetical protein
MVDLRQRKVRDFVEVAGGISILAGLFFVGLELKQNTAAVQAATNQDLIHASSDFLVTIGSDPETSRIYASGRRNPDDLRASERIQYLMLQQAFWLRMQNAYMQWQRDTLIDEDWIVYQTIICASADTPGPEAHWKSLNAITPAFKDFLEKCGE